MGGLELGATLRPFAGMEMAGSYTYEFACVTT
jgi:hypothetical protein